MKTPFSQDKSNEPDSGRSDRTLGFETETTKIRSHSPAKLNINDTRMGKLLTANKSNSAIAHGISNKNISGKTIIIITHRMENCKFADNIVVLKNGTDVASGNHETLMKNNQYYRNLFERNYVT